ncbi:MAG: peptidylprolyl isomerase [Thermoanaerobaculia bacterium]
MPRAKDGDKVKVHYTGKFDDGRVFDSSQEREPLAITLGEGEVIPGFEDAIRGMEPGQTRSEHIPADRAYGPRREDMVVEVSRDSMPPEIKPEPGQWLQMQLADGRTTPVRVDEVTEEAVRLDANHPLAGKDLNFEINLIDIENDQNQ